MTNENDQNLTSSSQQKLTKYSSDLIKKGLGLAKSIQEPTDSAESWKLKGNEFLRAEAYEEALLCYEKALGIDPTYSDAWNNHGVTLSRLELYEEAILSLDKALKFNPYDKIAWKNRARILSSELNLYEEAVISCDKCLEIDPNDWESWWLRGTDLERLRCYEQAAGSYNKSLQIKYDNWLVWVNHAKNFYFNMHNYEESLFCCNKALEFFKVGLTEFPQVQVEEYYIWMIKGSILSKFERYEEALDSYQKALSFNPNEKDKVVLLFQCGHQLYYLNRHKEAIFYFDKVLEINPQNRDSWSNKGFIFKENALYEDALFCYNKVLSLTDLDSEEWDTIIENIIEIEDSIENLQTKINLEKDKTKKTSQQLCEEGLDEYFKRDYKLAISKLNDAITLDCNYTLANKCRGYIYFQIENYENAISDFTYFINSNLVDKSILTFRSIAYYKLGKHEESIGDLKQLQELYFFDTNVEQYNKISNLIKVYEEWKVKIKNSSLIEFNENSDEYDFSENANSEFFKSLIVLGDFASDSGNFNSAIEYYTEALTFDPENSQIYNKRSTARSAIKDYQGAMEDLQKARKFSL